MLEKSGDILLSKSLWFEIKKGVYASCVGSTVLHGSEVLFLKKLSKMF